MHTEIARLPADVLPAAGPRLLVVERASGSDPASRYQHAPHALPAATPLVALARSASLATPDQLRVLSASRAGTTFTIELELRSYQGPIAANDPWVALVQADLGSLPPGSYDLIVTQTTLSFHNIRRPDQASSPTATTDQLHFVCT